MVTMLVVDDDRLNCDLIQAVFARQGYHVLTALSGREALELFDQHRPLVTLLDLRMPEMDGLAVLKEIRARAPYAAVVMVGAGATDFHENMARELGVTDFLRKGLSLDVLMQSVNHAVQTSEQAADAVSAGVTNSGYETPSFGESTDSILVVDDEFLVRDLLVRFLSMRGYRAQGAASGEAALAAVQRQQPDLILLDLTMPEMSGVEVLRALRANDFPGGVIVLTGSHDQSVLYESWELGVQEVLFKPVDLDRLLTAVQLVLVCREC
ncbi:MAG: response regulator [Nitrospiraceae bacterium]